MKRYRIRFLPYTISDREEIRVYLSRYYESTVKKFFTLLKDKIAQLKDFPYSCPVHEDDPDYRRLVVGGYLVFYMAKEDEKIVEIHRILHGSRNIQQHLK